VLKETTLCRLSITVRGAVQGVGFRPFVFRLATKLSLTGWVCNAMDGVHVDVEGANNQLETFLLALEVDAPPLAVIHAIDHDWHAPADYTDFEIRQSGCSQTKVAVVLPDVATCPECVKEIFDPDDRRYGYAFTNCTNCGPRFSIIEAVPYDRCRTSMRRFTMCADCQAEYDDPADRRFHAQPNACPRCGPRLELWGATGHVLALRTEALGEAVRALAAGRIIAVKGIGGFHLMVDACNASAVKRLRRRRHREEKPLAVMFPLLVQAREHVRITPLEQQLLTSSEAPIVLVGKRTDVVTDIAAEVAPRNSCLGVLLPYSPLHHLLMREFGSPVVATSGNLTDEPICTDEREAVRRLGGVADLFLIHDRHIVRPVDDSVVRVVGKRPMLMRRARGYAPLPIRLGCEVPNALAVGGHLKSTVAVAVDRNVFIGPHIGELDTAETYNAFEHSVDNLQTLYDMTPDIVVCDLHPDYRSTQYAESLGLPVVHVQHHHAHVLSCMAEHQLQPPVLGVAWDGTGYGGDGTVWGGEFLRIDPGTFTRVAGLRPFRLPGGEQAVREPRRAALGLLHAMVGGAGVHHLGLDLLKAFSSQDLDILIAMLDRSMNSPETSSAGRLFDAVAALLGLCQRSTFEGQAAMELESIASQSSTTQAYEIELTRQVIGWEPTVRAILNDIVKGEAVSTMARKFHNAMATAILSVAEVSAIESVVLSGGCFQNRYLTERTIDVLRSAGFRPYWHQQVPPNDGGLSLGQIAALSYGITGG